MEIQQSKATVDDLWELSHRSSGRYELVRGKLIAMSPTGGLHGYVTMEIGAHLRNYVREHDMGIITAAETGYILVEEPRTVRAPDAGFIRQDRLPNPLPDRYFELAPDLAVEVVSPGDTAKDIRDRVHDFLNAGTRAVWVIYPDAQSVDIHTGVNRGTLVETIDKTGMLSGGDIIKGFEVPVSTLFPAE